jgi:hypothetical protein
MSPGRRPAGNSRLKHHFGRATSANRRAAKIMAQLMSAVLALTVDQWLKLSG